MDPVIAVIITFLSVVFVKHQAVSLQKFRALYGVHFLTAAIIWIMAASVDSDITPEHILMFLEWLKEYPIEDIGAYHWKCDVKTYRKYLYKVLVALFITLDTVSFI